MKHFGLEFNETLIKLDLPTTTAEIKKFSPSGRVPCLVDGDLAIWDSMAIMEYLHERFPEKHLYPTDVKARAYARSISAEMHSGFADLRHYLSFNAKKHLPNFDSSKAAMDIERIKEIWSASLQKFRAPFLCGDFSIADAMYAPVVGRFKTYDVKLEPHLQAYADRILTLPAVKEWYAGAMAEDFVAQDHD